MKKETRRSLRSSFVELLVYAAAVFLYVYFALHVLDNWLVRLFKEHRDAYAATALLLILGQGIVLEALSRSLMSFIKPKPKD